MQQMILGSFAGDWFEVHDPVQARLLTDPVARGFLVPFIGTERSLTQAAREIGCSVQRLAYRVQQFQAAGLLRETCQQRRSGRPIKFYRAVSDGFHVPFEYTPFEDLEHMMTRLYLPFDRQRNRVIARRARQEPQAGRRIYRDAMSGELNSESNNSAEVLLQTQRSASPGNDVTLSVRLSDEDARRFAQEFEDLYQRLESARRPPGEGQAYLVHFGFLPLTAEDLEPYP
ncbi:hypothetical protein [Deinococcus sp. UYEF24]